MGCPLVPLNHLDAAARYVAAGARELYTGFYDPAWFERFGDYADLNRMSGFRFEANAYSFQELLGALPYLRSLGAELYVTFNTASYRSSMEPWLRWYFEQLAQAGATGVILSGPELIDAAHACGLQAVASTMCGIYNEHTARLYVQWGVDRIILPRDLSLNELRGIISANPSVQYEVFLMRNGCIFSDSHCLGMHGMGRGALCGELRRATRTTCSKLKASAVEHTGNLYCSEFHTYACGLCALWDLEQMGANAYKIVGRGDGPDAIVEDIELVDANIRIAQTCASRAEYLQNMVQGPYAGPICDRHLNCYYPEVWD